MKVVSQYCFIISCFLALQAICNAQNAVASISSPNVFSGSDLFETDAILEFTLSGDTKTLVDHRKEETSIIPLICCMITKEVKCRYRYR